MTELEPLLLPDAAAWRGWLDVHEDDSPGVWLQLAKKGQPSPTELVYAAALDEALCSGWIDGQTGRLDEASYRQRFTPRRPRSLWSQRNVGHVARLDEQGRMRTRGLAEVARARQDGRWDTAYAGAATIEPTPELAAALAASPAATAAFGRLSRQDRYLVLHRCTTPRTPRGRAGAAARFVSQLEQDRAPRPPG